VTTVVALMLHEEGRRSRRADYELRTGVRAHARAPRSGWRARSNR
jgi:hypothetical protein